MVSRLSATACRSTWRFTRLISPPLIALILRVCGRGVVAGRSAGVPPAGRAASRRPPADTSTFAGNLSGETPPSQPARRQRSMLKHYFAAGGAAKIFSSTGAPNSIDVYFLVELCPPLTVETRTVNGTLTPATSR